MCGAPARDRVCVLVPGPLGNGGLDDRWMHGVLLGLGPLLATAKTAAGARSHRCGAAIPDCDREPHVPRLPVRQVRPSRNCQPVGALGILLALWITASVLASAAAGLGPAAERLGPGHVLAAAVAGVPLGAALPAGLGVAIGLVGARILAIAGLMILGLAIGGLCALLSRRPRKTSS